MHSIGRSAEGNDLLAVRVGGYQKSSSYKPRVAVVAGINGNEAITTEISLDLLDYLIREYDDGDTTISGVCVIYLSLSLCAYPQMLFVSCACTYFLLCSRKRLMYAVN